MTHEELWVIERPKVEDWLRRKKFSRDAVQDIVDEAFFRLQGKSPERGALWKTTFNVLQEHLREKTRRVYLEQQAELLTGTAIPNIETAIIRADFDRAFRRLPRTLQEAFALTELRGLTERETADVLGISQPTVNRRCEAARTFLREELS